MALHLVRHGPPLIQAGRPAWTWPLDPTGTRALDDLRDALTRRTPVTAWHSSDEPKAAATAERLTDGPVEFHAELREAHRSDWFATHEEFRAAVFDAFANPDESARPGWEALADTRRRVCAAVAALVADGGPDLTLVGHGTAWTLLVSELTGQPPDLRAWLGLKTPDLCTVDVTARTVTHGWGHW